MRESYKRSPHWGQEVFKEHIPPEQTLQMSLHKHAGITFMLNALPDVDLAWTRVHVDLYAHDTLFHVVQS
jgi:hypothetical protein